MNPRMQSKEQLEMATHTEETATETERLARWAFTHEEIVSLLWL